MRRVLYLAMALSFSGVPLFAASEEAAALVVESEIRDEIASLRDRIDALEDMLMALVAARTPAETPAPAAAAQEDDTMGAVSTGGPPIAFTGLVDTYFTHNFNSPASGVNDLYYTNPNARGFGLNQLKLEMETTGDGPIGFRSDVWFGSGARLFREGLEPGPLADVLYLQQAYGYYRDSGGGQLDVGLFGTIAGLEVAESHLNWNYSRGLLWAWNEPFSHLGAKYSRPLSDTFTGTVMLVNGFDNAFDQNTGKSYGLQGSLAPNDRFNTTLTWIHGPENEGTNDGWQRDLSWNAYLGIHDRVEAMVNMDAIQAVAPDGATALSWGLGGYLRFHLGPQWRIAERFEFMNDREARSTGIEHLLMENTITLEYQPVADDPRMLARFEFRRDWSDQPFFDCPSCSGGLSEGQNTFTIGLSWVFGPK